MNHRIAHTRAGDSVDQAATSQMPWGRFLDHAMGCEHCRYAAAPTTGCDIGRALYRAVKAEGWR